MRLLLLLTPLLAAAQTRGAMPRERPVPQTQAPAPVKPEERAEVRGAVFNSVNGEPLRKAIVTMRGQMETPGQGPMAVYSATTDAAGQFTISGVEPGRYRMAVQRTGFVNQLYGARGSNRVASANPLLTLAKSQTMKDVIFRMIPQGVITGRVLDEDGEPAMGVMVNCMRQAYVRGSKQWLPVNGENTNDLGEYRIHSLSAGRYYVAATYRQNMFESASSSSSGGGEEAYAPTFYPSAPSPELGSAVDITAGAQIRGVDIQLRKMRAVRMTGRVVGGAASRNTMVRLASRSEGVIVLNPRTARVMDAAGNFMIPGVTPGSYWLIAETMEDGVGMSARLAVEVANTALENLVLTLTPGVDLSGTVKISDAARDEKPVNIRIQLEPKRLGFISGYLAGAAANAQGAFTLKGVRPDAYLVRVIGPPETQYVKSIRFGDTEVTDTGLDFSQGVAPGELVITVAAGAAQMDGSVQNDRQQAATSATVVLIPEGARRELQPYYKISNTDQSGQFSLKGIVPGEYRIYAFDQLEPGAYMDPDFMKPFESKGERVSLKENGRENLQLKVIDATTQP